MEPLTAGLMMILGKHALDRAAEIIPVVGAEAARIVRLLYDLVTGEISTKGIKEKVIAEGFSSDPETYEKPFAKLLEEEMNSSPAFANRVRALMDSYSCHITLQGADPQHRIGVKGNFRATGSVFGSGSVRTEGDIVGGDKKP